MSVGRNNLQRSHQPADCARHPTKPKCIQTIRFEYALSYICLRMNCCHFQILSPPHCADNCSKPLNWTQSAMSGHDHQSVLCVMPNARPTLLVTLSPEQHYFYAKSSQQSELQRSSKYSTVSIQTKTCAKLGGVCI